MPQKTGGGEGNARMSGIGDVSVCGVGVYGVSSFYVDAGGDGGGVLVVLAKLSKIYAPWRSFFRHL